MPTYQYACTECSHTFEQFQSFSEDALAECPQCHGRLRKVYNAVGVVFKGSGFYRTDSRATTTASEPAASTAESSGSSDSGSSTTTKTESKPAPASTSSSSSSASSSSSSSD